MKIDITIERIDNGYIFSGKGVTTGKHYYSNLEAFANTVLVEALREADKKIKEQKNPGEPFVFKLTTDLIGEEL